MTPTANSLSPAIRIVEVGPRDGLQNIPTAVPTATKLDLIRRLYAAGLKSVEITSLVSPRAIPQLSDSRQVLADQSIQSALKDPLLRAPVLVPNLQGLEYALRAGVREVAVFVSATEGFSNANIKCSVAEGLERAREAAARARGEGLAVRGYVSCIFADPYDGPTERGSVLRVVRALLDIGCYEVSLGDTLGVGTPAEVRVLVGYLRSSGIPLDRLAGHFHDTYGQAVANVWEAYQCGVRVFDSSVGGLGGCPFAPGAKGNVATEDVVFMFEQAGVQTGVNLKQLVAVGEWISKQLKKTNDSRAGAALLAKARAAAIQSTPPASGNTTQGLSWKLLHETEGLKIFRAGVNVKLLLDRPKNRNALTQSMISDLTQFFERAATDETIRRIAITGSGKFFCTGMDLGKGTSPVAQGRAESDAQYERLTRLFKSIKDVPQVTIACINGPAFGGGVGLAFVCDIRIAADNATVTLSEVKLGLCPATISKYVVREWGQAFAREAMLSARPIPMTELKRIGVLAQVVTPEHLDEALDTYLVMLRHAAPEASAMCKDLVRLTRADAGGEAQEGGIKKIFERMMRADGEAAVGLKLFQSGKKVSWDDQPLQGRLSKL